VLVAQCGGLEGRCGLRVSAHVFQVGPGGEDAGEPGDVVVVFEDLLAVGQEQDGFGRPSECEQRPVVGEAAAGDLVQPGFASPLAGQDGGAEFEGQIPAPGCLRRGAASVEDDLGYTPQSDGVIIASGRGERG